MKLSKIIVILALLAPLFAFSEITKNLSVGMTSDQVVELQKKLNSDPETQVSLSGPGSPNNETRFFGRATKMAVIKFQEKYKSEVLTPAGLFSGTGFVGSLTRLKLNNLTVAKNKAPVVEVKPNTDQKTPNNAVSPIVTPAEKPATSSFADKVQFDKASFLKAIDEVGVTQGYTPEQLANLRSVVEKDIDQNHPEKNFIPSVEKAGIKIHDLSTTQKTGGLMSLFEKIIDYFTPEKAYAFGTPFGGRILFSYFCTCTGNWLITLQPMGPTYATLLTYYSGTQMYMGYNLPFSLNVLGQYTQGSTCQIYIVYGCATLPSQGMISPTVGSSSI